MTTKMNRLGGRSIVWAAANHLARRVLGTALFALALQAAACGGDTKDKAAAPPQLEGMEAVNACNVLVNASCAKKMRCGSMLSDAECKEDVKNMGLDCPR